MPLSPAEKQRAYRDRKRAKRAALEAERARRVAELERAKATVERLVREAEEQAREAAADVARRAEEEAKARGIADGTLHPSGRPWRNDDARGYDAYSPRAMAEAGRRAALQQAVDSFNKTGALAPDPDGPKRRRESPFAGRIRYDWHRNY